MKSGGRDSIDWYTGTVNDVVVDHGANEERRQTRPMPAVAAPPGSGMRLVDEGEIARGGMGAVHKVHDIVILRHAAMKVLGDPERPDARVRFLREAQITGQLDHPNIVP